MFSLFNTKPQQQQQQQQQQQPGSMQSSQMPNNQQQQPNQQPGQNQGGQPNGQNTQSNEPANPLDVYSKMFDNANTEGDKPPAFAIDSKVMDEVVGSQDFTKGIDPAVMQKAISGDAQSMIEIMQAVGRNSYRSALEHGGVLTDKFVGAREQHGQKALGSKVRSELTTHALSNTPNFKHPVVKKQLTEIAQKLQQQHPDAGPEEIADMARNYITELAGALNPKKEEKSGETQEERGEEYWDKYFNS